ncbi:hypothetical protein D3C80_2116630 [compost metagenome]
MGLSQALLISESISIREEPLHQKDQVVTQKQQHINKQHCYLVCFHLELFHTLPEINRSNQQR